VSRPNATPNWRKPRVDPFATSDIARQHRLTATQSWALHLMALQAEYRSAEWTGSLTMLGDALRCGRKTAGEAVAKLVEKGLAEEIEPFRQGAEGRVHILVRDRIVISSRRPKIAPFPAIPSEEDRAGIATGSRRDRAGIATSDAIDQGEQGVPQVQRQRGSEVYESGTCCMECGQAADGHHPFDHDPIVAPLPEDAPPLSDDDFAVWVSEA
jgi:hypothetical protein